MIRLFLAPKEPLEKLPWERAKELGRVKLENQDYRAPWCCQIWIKNRGHHFINGLGQTEEAAIKDAVEQAERLLPHLK